MITFDITTTFGHSFTLMKNTFLHCYYS
ncbi:hypothetical protein D5018_18245 [Parashewanella curva]|uniref:Uncharacterized protein n=1 Tax=Parashewanella curva TaxID=2338552 RepID=A0A3L8PS74_9GAMM|nr:hypothetical protein D5018_18245 [Parashewanella curva]